MHWTLADFVTSSILATQIAAFTYPAALGGGGGDSDADGALDAIKCGTEFTRRLFLLLLDSGGGILGSSSDA